MRLLQRRAAVLAVVVLAVGAGGTRPAQATAGQLLTTVVCSDSGSPPLYRGDGLLCTQTVSNPGTAAVDNVTATMQTPSSSPIDAVDGRHPRPVGQVMGRACCLLTSGPCLRRQVGPPAGQKP